MRSGLEAWQRVERVFQDIERENQLILRVLRSEPVSALDWAVSLGSSLLLAGVAWYVAARLYHREELAASS